MLALFCAVSSCKKEPKAEAKPLNIGEWQLSSITAKNVAFAGQTIDVYVAFAEDGGFFVRPIALALAAFAAVMLVRRKLAIMSLIFICAVVGSASWGVLALL